MNERAWLIAITIIVVFMYIAVFVSRWGARNML